MIRNSDASNLDLRSVGRPDKTKLAEDIAVHLGLSPPDVSRGSSVASTFLDEVHRRIAGGPSGGSDSYRMTERLLQRLGRTYDPYWDTSESRGPKGGGTVTVRAFSQIRSAITGIDRCFLVPAPKSRDAEVLLEFDTSPGASRLLIEAGPGTKILYVQRSPVPKIVGTAEIKYVAPGWEGPWAVELENYRTLSRPVELFTVDGGTWSGQRVTEISWHDFQTVLAFSASKQPLPDTAAPNTPRELDDAVEPIAHDPAGDVVAERILTDFPIGVADGAMAVPQHLPHGPLTSATPARPSYRVEDDTVISVASGLPRRSQNRVRDRLAEQRGIEIAIAALKSDGWTLTRDRQKDGVGYDLEFTKDDQLLHAEVKGIQGALLTFNLTPKELWRAETDDRWIVVAVTSVLSPTAYRAHIVTRERVAAARLVITGYRVRI